MGIFDSVGDFLGGVGGIASFAAPVIGALKNKPKAPPAMAQLDQRATQANQFAGAAADPNDPMYRNLVRLEEEAGRVDIARAVNEHMRQRKAMMHRLGGRRYTSWFNPEREDEGMSQAISREGMEVGNRARTTARNTLTGSSNAISGNLPNTANLAQLQGQQELGRQNQNKAVFGAIGEAGRTLASGPDWLKALQQQLSSNSIYGPPGGYSYFGGPR